MAIEQHLSLAPVEQFIYQGRYREALVSIVDTLNARVARCGTRHRSVADAHHGIGVIFHMSGRKEWAQYQLQRALRLRASEYGDSHPKTAETLLYLASAYRNIGQREASAAAIERAREIVEATGENEPVAAALASQYAALKRLRSPNESIVHYRRALELYRSILGPLHPASISTLCWYAHALQYAGRGEETVVLLDECADLIGRCPIKELAIESAVYHALGGLQFRGGQYDGAEQSLRASIEARSRTLLNSPRWFGLQRASSAADARLTLLLLDQKRYEEAWEVLKAGIGWVSEAMNEPILSAGFDRAHILDLERRALALAKLCRTRHECGEPGAHEEIHIAYLNALADAFRGIRAPQGNAGRTADVTSRLGDNEALIGWMRCLLPGDDRDTGRFVMYAYIARNDGGIHWIPLINTDTRQSFDRFLQSGISAARKLHLAASWPMRAARDRELESDLRDVWQKRFEPIRQHLGDITRLIVPADVLQEGLPIECLIDGEGRFLSERFAVTYVPSIVNVVSPPHSANNKDELLVVCDPDFAGAGNDDSATLLDKDILRRALDGDQAVLRNLPRLPRTAKEARALASLFTNVHILDGTDATEAALDARVVAQTAQMTAIHFATHGFAHPIIPERSALVVTPLPDRVDPLDMTVRYHDGVITTREIQLGWQLDVDLVTLAACRTASGAPSISDGPLGFHQALIAAGVSQIVSSIWDADDEAAASLMRLFYRRFAIQLEDGTVDTAEALQRAQHEMRAIAGGRYAHPAYWAGFVIVGNSH
jgi:CHAT domain-containing protein/tetratricopeptide (TPR) repeat protein